MGRLIHSIHPGAATHAQTTFNDESTVSYVRPVITLLTQLIKVGKHAFGPHLKHAVYEALCWHGELSVYIAKRSHYCLADLFNVKCAEYQSD